MPEWRSSSSTLPAVCVTATSAAHAARAARASSHTLRPVIPQLMSDTQDVTSEFSKPTNRCKKRSIFPLLPGQLSVRSSSRRDGLLRVHPAACGRAAAVVSRCPLSGAHPPCPRPHPVFAANCTIFARRKSGQQPRRTAHPTRALLPLVAAFPGVARGSNSRISLRVHGACGGWWRRFNGGEGRGAGE